MIYRDDIEDTNVEVEPRELPVVYADPPGACCICGKPGQQHACFKCGKPVCMNAENYLANTACGTWILDTWHPDAPDENEYWCNAHAQES